MQVAWAEGWNGTRYTLSDEEGNGVFRIDADETKMHFCKQIENCSCTSGKAQNFATGAATDEQETQAEGSPYM